MAQTLRFVPHFVRWCALLALLGAPLSLVLVPTAAAGTGGGFVYTRASNPARTIVTDSSGQWVATFTNNTRTVSLRGPSRTFTDPTATSPFVSTTWVRVLAAPFSGTVDPVWLNAALANTSPDIIAISMQYLQGAPPIYNASGLKIAGAAYYGPLDPITGQRLSGADFNDYLGISWTYGTTVDRPEANEINSLDCSGFMRMVWGYRSGLPLTLSPNGSAIPRSSYQIIASAPGIVVVPNNGTQVTDLSRLAAGDLVFFDADPSDGSQIDHVGMYIGRDANGHYRFVSSRKTVNSPAFGTDYTNQGGRSILDGTGFWATKFRAVRRF